MTRFNIRPQARALSLHEEFKLLAVALLAISLVFASIFGYMTFAATSGETLTVTVQEAMTFTTDVSGFGNLNPGTAAYATTTTHVSTNSNTGFFLTLYGNDQGPANTVLDLTTDAAVGLTDQAEWIAGGATTSAGNAVVVGSLDNSGDVLAFRMMTASGSSDVISTTWWGADDTVGNALWSGIASSTDVTQIGNTSDYSASERTNTVLYYLDVAATQQTGTYDGGITYTATANP